jgi:hypothetical protein
MIVVTDARCTPHVAGQLLLLEFVRPCAQPRAVGAQPQRHRPGCLPSQEGVRQSTAHDSSAHAAGSLSTRAGSGRCAHGPAPTARAPPQYSLSAKGSTPCGGSVWRAYLRLGQRSYIPSIACLKNCVSSSRLVDAPNAYARAPSVCAHCVRGGRVCAPLSMGV